MLKVLRKNVPRENLHASFEHDTFDYNVLQKRFVVKSCISEKPVSKRITSPVPLFAGIAGLTSWPVRLVSKTDQCCLT